MKFVNILPTTYINNKKYWTSDWHLFLSHKIWTDINYTEEVRKCNRIKILDNGFFENGKAEKINTLVEKALDIKADYIILPDTFLENIEQFKHNIHIMCNKIPDEIKIIAIPLAKDLRGSLDAFATLEFIDRIDMIAIPDRLLTKWTGITRIEYLNKVIDKFGPSEKSVHCLALDDYRTLPQLAKFPFVNSVDSTTPFKLGYDYYSLPRLNFNDVKRPENYFEINKLSKIQQTHIMQNIKWIKKVTEEK